MASSMMVSEELDYIGTTSFEQEEGGLAAMEEKLRQAVRGNSHAAIQQAMDYPGLEIDVPLCRMIPMTDVRDPLKTDIAKLKAEFAHGYRRASASFYLSLNSYSMEESVVTEEHRGRWSSLWREQDELFESRLKEDSRLEKFSNRFFYVWDGNHRHLAWMDIINSLHGDDPAFHVSVRSMIINVTPQNRNMLLHAMTDWNK